MKKLLIATACVTAASFSAHAGDKVSDTLAKFDKTGEAVSCVPIRRIRHIKALDDSTFLVQVGQSDYYLNEVSTGCNRAATPNHRIQYQSDLSSLCENQIVSVIDNGSGFMSGSCSLSKFEELETAQ